MKNDLSELLVEIRNCRECEAHLPLGPRPIVSAHKKASILIVGQAPGIRVHESGIPWDDPSGERLREWMGLTSDNFYDATKVALMPMGFCYPGTGQGGDLPPRKECASLWHERLLREMPDIKLTLVLGRYAQAAQLKDKNKITLTETVQAWKEYRPAILPLPHPSPRNNRWLKKNPWYETDVIPYLQKRVKSLV